MNIFPIRYLAFFAQIILFKQRKGEIQDQKRSLSWSSYQAPNSHQLARPATHFHTFPPPLKLKHLVEVGEAVLESTASGVGSRSVGGGGSGDDSCEVRVSIFALVLSVTQWGATY